MLEHGVETGIIKRLPNGEYIETHQPLGPVDEHGHRTLTYAGAPVPERMNQLGTGRLRRIRGFFYPVTERPDVEAELRELAESEPSTSASPTRSQR